MRRLARTKKVGHAGTLDPMATGVLVLGIGRATRLLTYIVGVDKVYTATIRLGVTTLTDDAEGDLLALVDASAVTRAAIDAGVATLTGPIQQVPSAVSAIKVDGKRAYARVRAGESVELAARSVTIHRFEVHDLRPATADELAVLADDGPLPVLSLADAARATSPARELTAEETVALSFGKRIAATSIADAPGALEPFTLRAGGQPTAAFAPDGALVALLEDRMGQSVPVVVFAPA